MLRLPITGRAPGIPAAAALVALAEADAFRPSLGLALREALWAIKPPLFAAADARLQGISIFA